jgi:coatomer subunit epsilon
MEDAGTTGAGFEAVKSYAEYRIGKREKALEGLDELIQADGDDDTVQVLGATMLHMEGRTDEALNLLSRHENNLEAYLRRKDKVDDRVALIIQLRLAQHNIDAAAKELSATKSWAQDSLLAQLCEV